MTSLFLALLLAAHGDPPTPNGPIDGTIYSMLGSSVIDAASKAELRSWQLEISLMKDVTGSNRIVETSYVIKLGITPLKLNGVAYDPARAVIEPQDEILAWYAMNGPQRIVQKNDSYDLVALKGKERDDWYAHFGITRDDKRILANQYSSPSMEDCRIIWGKSLPAKPQRGEQTWPKVISVNVCQVPIPKEAVPPPKPKIGTIAETGPGTLGTKPSTFTLKPVPAPNACTDAGACGAAASGETATTTERGRVRFRDRERRGFRGRRGSCGAGGCG